MVVFGANNKQTNIFTNLNNVANYNPNPFINTNADGSTNGANPF